MQDYGLQDVAWAFLSLGAVTVIAFAIRGRHVIRRSLAALFDTDNTRRPLVRVVRSVNTSQAAAPHYVADANDAVPVRAPAEPAETAAVRGQTHQIELGELPKNEPAHEPSVIAITARLERAELITLLAVQKNTDGGYTFSANKITEFVGGTAADVKAQIAAIRNPPKQAEPPERGKSLRRPAEGW